MFLKRSYNWFHKYFKWYIIRGLIDIQAFLKQISKFLMVLNAILLWSLTVSTVLYFFLILMLILMFHAPVAQLVEHRAVTREVVSSTPAGPTLRVFK